MMRRALPRAAAIACWLAATLASARPGGGHSFGGGSHGGGGFSGGGGFHGGGSGGWGSELGWILFAVTIAVMVVAVTTAPKSGQQWSSKAGLEPRDPGLVALSRRDPNFSRIVLDDFVAQLYVRAHAARTDGKQLAALSPYLTARVREALLQRARAPLKAVSEIVVGAIELASIGVGTHDRAHYRVVANFTEQYAGGAVEALQLYVVERWSLTRRAGVVGRKPDDARAFNCPACGAPVQIDHEAACAACNAPFLRGDHDWMVYDVEVETEATAPQPLGGYAPEVDGGRLRLARDRDEQLATLQREDPSFSQPSFEQRVALVYQRLNHAWSSLQWDDFRPFGTDRFWLAQRYWIDSYRAQGLRNRMDGAAIDRITLVKLERDPFFWAITVHVRAHAVDTTVHEATGRIVGGSTSPRSYAEYWTFIRSVDRHGAATATATCPNCGADAKVGMAGNCDACGVKLTGGAYDWVLSTIEQDEVYR